MNIIRDGNKLLFFNEAQLLHKLEVANYSITWDSKGNTALTDEADFDIPADRFKVDEDLIDTICKTVNHSKKNVGVLLTGFKGQGGQKIII